MPDWVIVLVALVTSLVAEGLLLTAFMHRFKGTKEEKTIALQAAIIPIVLWSYFFWAMAGTWKVVSVKELQVKDYRHQDGTFTQYIEGENPESGQSYLETYKCYFPPGTKMRLFEYEPWCRGIRWTGHWRYEPILPEAK